MKNYHVIRYLFLIMMIAGVDYVHARLHVHDYNGSYLSHVSRAPYHHSYDIGPCCNQGYWAHNTTAGSERDVHFLREKLRDQLDDGTYQAHWQHTEWALQKQQARLGYIVPD